MRRYAGGALRRALNAEDFYEATSQGLSIINVDRLNREARHWARLNAGAGGVGKGSKRTFEVRASNLVLFTLGLGMAPRPAFGGPPGFWLDRGTGKAVKADPGQVGNQEFHPKARTPKKRTRGIEAANFLDAPLNRIARDLFSEQFGYPSLMKSLWESATPARRVQLGLTVRPTPFATRVRVGRSTGSG